MLLAFVRYLFFVAYFISSTLVLCSAKDDSSEQKRRRISPRVEYKPASNHVFQSKFQKDLEYQLVKPIGSGAYGDVWEAKQRIISTQEQLKESVAIKIGRDDDAQQSLKWEFKLLTLLKDNYFSSPFTVDCYDFLEINGTSLLVLKLCDYNLGNLIRSNPSHISINNCIIIAFSLLLFTKGCMKSKIVHLDLKPENILIINQSVVVCDLGLAIHKQRDYASIADLDYPEEKQSLWYRSPKVCSEKKPYDITDDLWSIGCILYEMVTGEVLFPSSSPFNRRKQMKIIQSFFKARDPSQKPPIHSYIYERFIQKEASICRRDPILAPLYFNLIKQLIRNDRREDLNIDNILSHQIFREPLTPQAQDR